MSDRGDTKKKGIGGSSSSVWLDDEVVLRATKSLGGRYSTTPLMEKIDHLQAQYSVSGVRAVL